MTSIVDRLLHDSTARGHGCGLHVLAAPHGRGGPSKPSSGLGSVPPDGANRVQSGCAKPIVGCLLCNVNCQVEPIVDHLLRDLTANGSWSWTFCACRPAQPPASKMESEWCLRGSQSDNVKYTLPKMGRVWTKGLCVEPTFEAHERYSNFISEIKGKYIYEDGL